MDLLGRDSGQTRLLSPVVPFRPHYLEMSLKPSPVLQISNLQDSTNFCLNKDEIRVFYSSVDSVCDKQVAEFGALLSEEEIRRISCLKTIESQREYVISHGALRLILGEFLQIDPSAIQFALGPCGKPYLAMPNVPKIEFNISHSHGLMVFAFSRKHVLGVDVELIDPSVPNKELIETVFTASEREYLYSLPPEQLAKGFFTAWTRKEALIKATGQGFSADLQSFSVPPSSVSPAFLSLSDASRCWEIQSLYIYADYACALVFSVDKSDSAIL